MTFYGSHTGQKFFNKITDPQAIFYTRLVQKTVNKEAVKSMVASFAVYQNSLFVNYVCLHSD